MREHVGACRCGRVEVRLRSEVERFQPRSDAATCAFCTEHDGVWVSDPAGRLLLRRSDVTRTTTFASGQVQFHFCAACDTLVYARFEDVAVARVALFPTIRSVALPTVSTSFDGETVAAGRERRLAKWTPWAEPLTYPRPMGSSRCVALLLVSLTACGGASASSGGAAGAAPACEGQVTLQLAWPDALQAHVAGRLETEDEGVTYPGGTTPEDLTMRVTTEGDVRRMHYETHVVSDSSAHGLMPSMQGVYADVLFARDGEVRGIEGGEQMRMALASIAEREHPDPQQVQLMAEAIGDGWLLAHAKTYWELFGKLWAGRTFTCGSTITVHSASTEMGFGHVAADVHTDLTWLGWRSCPPRSGGPSDGRCVLLRATQTATLPAAHLGGGVHRLDARRVAELVVEPETLVPRGLRFREESHLDGAAAIESAITEEYAFGYETPTPAGTGRATILAMTMPNGRTFFWPADPATGGPMQLPRTPACEQLRACCEALANVAEAHALICATSVATHRGTDCDSPLRMTDTLLGMNQVALPSVCAPGGAPAPPPPAPPHGAAGSI